MSFFTAITCLFGIGCIGPNMANDARNTEIVHMHTFESVIGESTEDGDFLIFSDPGALKINTDIVTFIVGDKSLSTFLGVGENRSVAIEITENRTNFHVYDIPIAFKVGNKYPWLGQEPKKFNQLTGFNPILGLEYAKNIRSDQVQMTLVYSDESKAAKLAGLLTDLAPDFETVSFKCWDLVKSDIDEPLFKTPVLVVSSSAHDSKVHTFHGEINDDSLRRFVEANVYKLRVAVDEL